MKMSETYRMTVTGATIESEPEIVTKSKNEPLYVIVTKRRNEPVREIVTRNTNES
jgi:hypothetical protein